MPSEGWTPLISVPSPLPPSARPAHELPGRGQVRDEHRALVEPPTAGEHHQVRAPVPGRRPRPRGSLVAGRGPGAGAGPAQVAPPSPLLSSRWGVANSVPGCLSPLLFDPVCCSLAHHSSFLLSVCRPLPCVHFLLSRVSLCNSWVSLSLCASVSLCVCLSVSVCLVSPPHYPGSQVGRTFDPATVFVVDDLKPNTEYAFRLAARSPQGLGAFTSVVRQRTLQSSRCLVDPALICVGTPRPAQVSSACIDRGGACRSGWGVLPAHPCLVPQPHTHPPALSSVSPPGQ